MVEFSPRADEIPSASAHLARAWIYRSACAMVRRLCATNERSLNGPFRDKTIQVTHRVVKKNEAAA